MIAAAVLLETLVDAGIGVVFTNPGTSEIHYVAALDDVSRIRGVLCLHENVATGAADGYARITRRPAAVLLHLGPGLANGLANLHNARRAHSPVVTVVGDHATSHQGRDTPLESRISTLADWTEGWSRAVTSAATIGADTAEAICAAATGPGGPVTLVVPADVAWSDGGPAGATAAPPPRAVPSSARIAEIAELLTGDGPAALLLGAPARDEAALRAAARIAAATGTIVLVETLSAHLVQGGDVPGFPRVAYFPEQARAQFAGVRHAILVEAGPPYSLFAYQEQPSDLLPPDVAVHRLAEAAEDGTQALLRLADLVAPERPAPHTGTGAGEPLPNARLDRENWAQVVARLLPADAIVSDEAVSLAAAFQAVGAGARRHEVLGITGAAIGQGLPVALGAALAAPDRPVVALQADGSAIYTISALWTMARERADVTVVILDNGAYAILDAELARTGREAGPAARSLTTLAGPSIDFVSLAHGFGVPATRATTTDALAAPGPHLIDAVLAPAR